MLPKKLKRLLKSTPATVGLGKYLEELEGKIDASAPSQSNNSPIAEYDDSLIWTALGIDKEDVDDNDFVPLTQRSWSVTGLPSIMMFKIPVQDIMVLDQEPPFDEGTTHAVLFDFGLEARQGVVKQFKYEVTEEYILLYFFISENEIPFNPLHIQICYLCDDGKTYCTNFLDLRNHVKISDNEYVVSTFELDEEGHIVENNDDTGNSGGTAA